MLLTETHLRQIVKSYLLSESESGKVGVKGQVKKHLQADLDQGSLESILGNLNDAAELYEAISKDSKAAKFTEEFVSALAQASPKLANFLSSPQVTNSIKTVTKIGKSALVSQVVSKLGVISEVLAFLILLMTVPMMFFQTLENLRSIEGAIENQKNAPGRKKKGPLDHKELAVKFEYGSLAKLGINTRQELFNILAADVMAPESGKSVGFKMLEKGTISKSFWGEILKARDNVKKGGQFEELVKKAEQLPKEVKHQCIVLGMVCNIAGAFAAMSGTDAALTGATDFLSYKGFAADDFIKFAKFAYDKTTE